MDKQDYINELKTNLHGLSNGEINEAAEFYLEYMEDAHLDTRVAIVDKLGTPKQLAHKIMADYSIKSDIQESKSSDEHRAQTPKSPKTNSATIWIIILALLSTPVTIPLALLTAVFVFVALLLVGVAVVVICALYFSAVMVGFKFIQISLGLLFTKIFAGLFYLGTGLTILGIALLIIPVVYTVLSWLIQELTTFVKFIYRKISRKSNRNGGPHYEENNR